MATTEIENLISNLSYTEKDFQTIYPALLDLVKKETLKWDPSISNESDPGVILLKLNALIADKCNYNIDKNVLECFPLSVTQEQNARQLFEQLGYYMPWYKSAETVISIKYSGDTQTDTNGNTIYYNIPAYSTMVCDTDSNIIYTLVDSKSVSTSGEVQTFTAIQGIATSLTVNGDANITAADLDSHNRIYFDTNTVAENGIFINNVGSENYSDWVRKDNLLTEQISNENHFYKFGISQDLNNCYLEFPENYQELFQDGINITYLVTSGAEGNVASGILTNIYNELTAEKSGTDSTETETETLTTDVLTIKNYIAGTGGSDPETIDDAYTNYKRTIGTFDTLVTLRDYINAVRNSDYVSNAIVSDRTTDVQSSYDIMSKNGTIDQCINIVEDTTSYTEGYLYSGTFYLTKNNSTTNPYGDPITPVAGQNYYDLLTDKNYQVIIKNGTYTFYDADPITTTSMDAFDLKMYLLSTTQLMETTENYNKTFELNLNDITKAVVEAEINDNKCVQHNFKDIEQNKICFIKNKYPINCKVIPQYTLVDDQKAKVIENIKKALFKYFNSTKVEFGAEVTYEEVYNVILDADSRIKSVALDPLEFTPYAVIVEPSESDASKSVINEYDISEPETYMSSLCYFSNELATPTDAGTVKSIINVYDSASNITGTAEGIKLVTSPNFVMSLINYVEAGSSEIVANQIIYSNNKWIDSPSTGTESKWQHLEIESVISDAVSVSSLIDWISANTKKIVALNEHLRPVEFSVINYFRTDIYAKSVLAGKTQFFIKDTEFDFGINQKYQILEKTIGRLEPCLDVTLNASNNWEKELSVNEAVQLFAPNLMDYNSYSESIRFEYYLNKKITADTTYKLNDGEYIIFYWTDSTDLESAYKYAIYGSGAIICPNFSLDSSASSSLDLVGATLLDNVESVTVVNNTYLYAEGDTSAESNYSTLYTNIKNLTNIANVLSGSRKIVTKLRNSLVLEGSGYYCYWVLNETESGEYVLFENNSGITSRLLKANEYFIYTNADKTDMTILGSGTQIVRSSNFTEKLSCTAIDYSEIVSNGLSAITEYLVQLPSNQTVSKTLTITEMQYMAFGDGTVINIKPKTPKYIEDTALVQGLKYEYYIPNQITAGNSYVLKDGEYFICYGLISSSPLNYKYAIYGEGSLINTAITLNTSVESVDKLIGYSLINNCKVNYGYSLDITKYAIITELMSNNGLKISSDTASNIIYSINEDQIVYINNTDYKVTEIDYENSIVYVKEDTTGITTGTKLYYGGFDVTDNSYLYCNGESGEGSELSTNINNKVTTQIASDDDIIFEVLDMPTINELHLSGNDTILENFDIKYKENTSATTWTSVAAILLSDSSLNWHSLALLSLNVSKEDAQALGEGQSLKYYHYDATEDREWIITKDKKDNYTDEEWAVLKPGIIDPNDPDSRFEIPTYLLTSTSINQVGPQVATLYTTDSTDDTKNPISIYAYIIDTNMDSGITFENGEALVRFAGIEGETPQYTYSKTIHFKLPNGNYIMPISHNISKDIEGNKIITRLEVYRSTTDDPTEVLLGCMGNAALTNLAEAGQYYIRLDDLPDSDSKSFFVNVTLKLTYAKLYDTSSEVPVCTVTIPPIFKYSDNDTLSSEATLNAELQIAINDRIIELDLNHNLFDYTYVVDDDYKIEDPLLARSYFDSSHILNSATICQLDTSDTTVYITNTLRR